MSPSGALDLGISLFFVYLLVSLLCTAACELIASVLAMRQKMLFDAVGTLLGNAEQQKQLFAHPLLVGISHGRTGTPSYIPRELFAAAALDVLAKSDGTVTKDLQVALLALTRGTKAEAKLQAGFAKLDEEALAVKEALSRWFEDSMSRAAGAYKRHSQRVVLAVACALVVLFNIDTVAIARTLWLRPELRSAIAEQAATYVTTPSATPAPATDPKQALLDAQEKVTATTEALSALGLPLGWPDAQLHGDFWTWASKVLGWLITILACSLGAPFWFDLLGKLVNVRSSGKRPV